MTFTSASLLRAIIPSNVLLPTPLPEKIPTRCPCPIGNIAAVALTPSWIGSEVGGRDKGFGGFYSVKTRANRVGRGDSSKGQPTATTALPVNPRPTLLVNGIPVDSTRQPCPISLA